MAELIVALDVQTREEAVSKIREIGSGVGFYKIGLELFTAEGPDVVKAVKDLGKKVFLDLKFHDIPNTTAQAVAAAADLGVWMVNVHASGGRSMMEAAAAQLRAMGSATLLTAVTVLTSMGGEDLRQIGVAANPEDQVLRLAALARDSGLDGVVCSALEAGMLARRFGADFLRVTPGIRPAGAAGDDQKRTMTPAEALAAGSTHLVIGRPVTRAGNPRDALLAILAEIGEH